jgi:hypothetical protein
VNVQTATRRISMALLLVFAAGAASAQDAITISGVVTTRADGLSVPGAVVSVVDASEVAATTDTAGRYTLNVPRSLVRAERIQLKIDALGLPSKIVDVVVSGPTLSADVALSLGFTEQVTVGSRAAGAEAEKAVAVDIITHDQIASTGYSETAQVIESLAPSFNFPRPTITDGTDTVRPATLRGLGPDQVLVLEGIVRRKPVRAKRAGLHARQRHRFQRWRAGRRRRLVGNCGGERQRLDRVRVSSSQSYESRVLRSARPDRRRRRRAQRRIRAEPPMGRSGHTRPDDIRQC